MSMLNDMLPDFEGSKINACVDNIYRIWEETADKKSAQLVFCDLSTPKNDGTFSVYNDIRKKLIERGVPESEVRFIHEADTDVKKKELFQKTRKGEVRVLLGSTQKMGAGTNVQDRLIALHDVDCPWRPSDLEQRSGRIIRQGNSNPDVDIYRYVTEQTFDAYAVPLWEKANLTIYEAAAYSGIGADKLRELSDREDCEFVLWNGTKRLIKRKKLDEFLERAYSI